MREKGDSSILFLVMVGEVQGIGSLECILVSSEGEGEVKGVRVGGEMSVSMGIFYPYSWCDKVFS